MKHYKYKNFKNNNLVILNLIYALFFHLCCFNIKKNKLIKNKIFFLFFLLLL